MKKRPGSGARPPRGSQVKTRGGINLMQKAETKDNVSFEVQLTAGRAGTDPKAPDWEVREFINGVINNEAEIYDNLTKAEAEDLAAMWMRKKEEAGA
jgi:hypothetical protein